ncbi:hypothetical protein ABGD54_RS20615 [Escherichia coli]|nr:MULTISPECIES: hypothetical protein [Escherichia]EEV2841570.1 hypothetical protein [Escherichia coli O43:H2]EKH5968014.1 hypothetical protein [Escherichia coli O43]EKM2616162.1 hypothetical protein [Escherichia coli O121]AWJ47202.1 hypothetical protein I3W_01080 [Escherichia coli O43 str. RM10042]EEQ1489730.1 hypothetical protein [Escherichia coli]
MEQEMTFSLSYEQLTRFAEKCIRECNLDSQGVTYLCESAKAGAVLTFWHELAINGYTSMNAIKRQEIIDADFQRLRKLIWPEDDWK